VSTALQTYDPEAFAEPVLATERVCGKCGKRKPVSKFRHPNSAKCNSCLCQGSQLKQKRRLQTALANLAQQRIVAAARGDRIDAPRISQVCGEMFQLLGGVEGFCKRWFTHLEMAMQTRPGSKMVLDECHALAKLLQMSTASIDAAGGGVESLSDEDLDREIDNAVARIVNQNVPELEAPEDDADTPDDLDTDEAEFDDNND